MFVTEFKTLLQTLPCQEEGISVLLERIQQTDKFNEFFIRITNYSLNKSQSSGNLLSPVLYDPHLFQIAFVISRFPVETLDTPEEPLRFTLLNKAIEFLGATDSVLYVCSHAEDDSADDFLDSETAADFLLALNEFHNAWNVLRSEGKMNEWFV